MQSPVNINRVEVEQVKLVLVSWECTLQRTCHGHCIITTLVKMLQNDCIS